MALLSSFQNAFANEVVDDCLIGALKNAPDDATVGEIKASCTQYKAVSLSALGQRAIQKHEFDGNVFEMAPHRPNYLLPATWIDNPNQQPFVEVYDDQLQNQETQFQISFKTTLIKGVLQGKGELVAGYTNRSFWQAYNGDISRPFRETNHEPEVMLIFESDNELFGLRNSENSLGFNHQSNGQSGSLSRSWNRLMLRTLWEKDQFAFVLRPWYRLPEAEKENPFDPDGDDNPDITRYLGNFDFQGAYTWDEHTFSLMLRKSFESSSYGAVELGWGFPMPFYPEVRGYLKYFNGYGESLIDYNSSTESIALGVEINDW